MGSKRCVIKLQAANEYLYFKLLPTTLIRDFKHAVLKELKDYTGQIIFVYNGKVLREDETLRDANIASGSTIYAYDKTIEKSCQPSRKGDVKISANRICNENNCERIAEAATHRSGKIHEMNNLQNQMHTYTQAFNEIANTPCIQKCLANPRIMSRVVDAAPKMLNRMQHDPSRMLKTCQQLQRSSSMTGRSRSSSRRSNSSCPYALTDGDLQSCFQSSSSNPNLFSDLFDSADVKDMLRQFQHNPKKAMKHFSKFTKTMNCQAARSSTSRSEYADSDARDELKFRPDRVKSSQVSREDRYDEIEWEKELNYLRRKGFKSRRTCIKALQRTDGDVKDAIHILRRHRSQSRE